MAGGLTICSDDDYAATLRKLQWSLVPEFLILNGKGQKNRLRNYSLVLSEAELGHIEKLCAVKVPYTSQTGQRLQRARPRRAMADQARR